MTESELYRSLGELTKNKARWKENIPYVASLLASDSEKIQAKALWMLGRIGRGCFESIEPYWADLFRFARDEAVGVRLAFIWASENIVCNYDLKPGYAGVENPLYSREKGVYLELGDAKETLMRLMAGIA